MQMVVRGGATGGLGVGQKSVVWLSQFGDSIGPLFGAISQSIVGQKIQQGIDSFKAVSSLKQFRAKQPSEQGQFEVPSGDPAQAATKVHSFKG